MRKNKKKIQAIPIVTSHSISNSEPLSVPISPCSVSISISVGLPLPSPSPLPLPAKNSIATQELIVPNLGTKEKKIKLSMSVL